MAAEGLSARRWQPLLGVMAGHPSGYRAVQLVLAGRSDARRWRNSRGLARGQVPSTVKPSDRAAWAWRRSKVAKAMRGI